MMRVRIAISAESARHKTIYQSGREFYLWKFESRVICTGSLQQIHKDALFGVLLWPGGLVRIFLRSKLTVSVNILYAI